MVVCHFFLQGECRFGENCRFEHQLSSGKPGNQQFGNIQNQNKIVNPKTGTEIELSTLLNSVKNDVVSGERGKQWLLSCYAPFKEKPLYPGFVDMSFEEVRFGFIEAQKSNSLQQYSQQLQQLLTEAKIRYKSLENPTKEIVELLKNIYNNNLNSGNNSFFAQNSQEKGLKSSFGLNSPSIFGQQSNVGGSNSIFNQPITPQNESVFGQSNTSMNTGSIFGQQQNAPTLFQQANSTQNNGNLFAQQSSTSSLFGQKTGSVFGQQQTGGSIFGQQSSGSVFGQQNPSGGSIFGQANPATRGIFGQNNPNNNVNTTQASNSPFNQANTGSIFGKPGVFGQQNQSAGSLFSQQNSGMNNAGSVFGGQQSTSSSTSIFGQQNNSPNNNVGLQSSNQNSANIFTQPNSNQGAGSIFGLNAAPNSTNNIFQSKPQGDNTQQGNLFKPSTQTGVFGKTQTTSNLTQQASVFAKPPEQGSLSTQSSIFQTSVNKPQPGSIFGLNPTGTSQSNPNSAKTSKKYIEWGAYSKKEDLTEEEIKWFNSDEFDVGNIPEKPPAYEMCF